MKRRWRQLVCVLMFLFTACFEQGKAVEVHLQGLDIGIDDATGSLVSISSAATGLLLQAPPESAGLLDVAYPVNSFAAMRLASRFSHAEIVQQGPQEVIIK